MPMKTGRSLIKKKVKQAKHCRRCLEPEKGKTCLLRDPGPHRIDHFAADTKTGQCRVTDIVCERFARLPRSMSSPALVFSSTNTLYQL